MKKTVFLVLILIAASIFSACANLNYGETGNYIVTPKEALEMIEGGTIVVDVSSAEEYSEGHIEGAINIPMSELTVSEPYANMLPEAKQIQEVMGTAGIKETDEILVYDNASNMQAARVQWTLNMYSNFNVKVISGGLEALIDKGAEVTTVATVLEPTEYVAGEYQKTLIAKLAYIKSVLNEPDENIVIIDTRSDEEYNEGTIPGACHIEYVWNMYASGQYKSPRDIQSTYIAKGITPDMRIILFCKTSVRAAQTYAALKDAGYNDVRIYDGAWLEYVDVEGAPEPSEDITPTAQDAS